MSESNTVERMIKAGYVRWTPGMPWPTYSGHVPPEDRLVCPACDGPAVPYFWPGHFCTGRKP